MSRIVAGTLGGRRLVTPPGRGTRPTSDRVREALFGTLGSLTDLAGARFADLYAGSGAVGLEAYSRGASHVLLVESDQRAARAARANIAALAAGSAVRLVVRSVNATLADGPELLTPARPAEPAARAERAGGTGLTAQTGGAEPAGPARAAYDIIFADPPYATPDPALVAVQQALIDGGWLAPGAIVVIERATRDGPVPWVAALTALRDRRYGETTLWYGQRP